MPTASPSPFVAVDANVVMDLGARSDAVTDALATIRRRLRSPRIVLTPTATLELMHIARFGDTAKERDLALSGMAAARQWRIVPVNLMPVDHGIVELIAGRIRSAELLPASEVNDSQLVAESALLGAQLLLSSDQHLRSMDYTRLAAALQGYDLATPVIATPAEVVRKFFQR